MSAPRLSSIIFAVAAAIPAFVGVSSANADEMRVTVDQAAVIRLPAAAAGVIVGNPSVAGVAVQSDRMISVTGRSYGVTNVIVVGHAGQILFSSDVRVVGQQAGVVTVQRGPAQERYDCAPRCERALDPGDDGAAFEADRRAVDGKSTIARANP
jgi:hypothetical protein